ncbi:MULTISPECIES: L-threonylcarbamoyladenylate synthase [unclassified Thalassotalea]|uniref:L-threonylcarbamoyladenylate synthase n=1 Tax=unclassified Thalassotalea TaxID=2614972 RepID=UPI0010813673|nr:MULTISPECIES: L-threonylcarbamoyladenylate synthase [unclassified Thalassotalea]NMP17860.1 threonylcarbamoyl-AMP synthase [Thalassotalea sp. Y01]QBY04440.1 threonylcarbamoyl-AMP synthase [Thalassotalea sp. HSM 43]
MNNNSEHPMFENAVDAFNEGGIIAYPTEAVFGLGCDPDNNQAIERLLALKQRPIEKGLILLAANYSQLLPYVDDAKIPQHKRFSVLSRWPDGITQVMPANANISKHLSGKFDTIAVRVTSQKDVVALCKATGKPIVSTSCNISGQQPATTWQQAEQNLGAQLDFIIKGDTLGFDKPSTIIDALSGEVLRT